MSQSLIHLFLLAAAGLPLFLFNFAFLPGIESALSLAALACGFALWGGRFTWAPKLDGATVGLCFCLALALCLLGGELHIFSPTSDWVVRDAVLHDLTASSWPVQYIIDGQDFLLRAPIGMYLVPAAVGKILGLVAAHYALFLQNAAVLGALLIIFTARSKTWRERILILSVFIFFSGLDLLPWAKGRLYETAGPFDWHLEVWVDWLQYSSHLTQLFWVPHHALAGWGFIAAYLSWRRGDVSAWQLISVFALCSFWSPLVMMGALPFLGYALLSDLRAGRLNLREAPGPLLVAAGSLPAIAYLMIDSGTVEKRWLFLDPGYPARYAVFLVVELVLWFWIFYITPRQENEPFKRSDIVVAGVSLLLLPLYSIGFSNDFTMRASIPALALIALAAAPRIGSMLQVPGARRIVLATGLAIAAATPGVEIARAIAMPTIALGSCSLPHAWKDWMQEIGRRVPMTSYIARSDTRPAKLLLAPPAQAISADQPCGPHIYAFPFTLPEARNAKLETVHGQTP